MINTFRFLFKGSHVNDQPIQVKQCKATINALTLAAPATPTTPAKIIQVPASTTAIKPNQIIPTSNTFQNPATNLKSVDASRVSDFNTERSKSVNDESETFMLKCTQNKTSVSGLMQCQYVASSKTIKANQASKASLIEDAKSSKNNNVAKKDVTSRYKR